jgi:hypothetical protein
MSREELDSIIEKFDRFSHDPDRQKRARLSLAHEIDTFLAHFSLAQTPRRSLVHAQAALSRCNLPLTNYIFSQEAGLSMAAFPEGQLELSAEIAVTVVSEKRSLRSISTQCDLVDYYLPKRLVGKMVRSLETIRGDVSRISERHEARKRKQKLLIDIVRSDHLSIL